MLAWIRRISVSSAAFLLSPLRHMLFHFRTTLLVPGAGECTPPAILLANAQMLSNCR